MAAISLKKIEKSYGELAVVHGLDLEIADREFVVFVGPSGCGKSTTLRMIAGLESISGGDLHIGDRRVNELTPGDRDIAMVFQNYALYPHMTVEQNISFGLRQRKASKQEIAVAVSEAAKLLSIEPLLKRKPRALSGGQRQRVAMGRAIVRKPQVFLFDEPLSNLDAKLRVQMRSEIKRLHALYPTTTVYVTHDQVEAMTMADRVVVMNKGVIEQVGPPQELYKNPASQFVAGFLGSPSMNFLPCKIVADPEPVIRFIKGPTFSLPQTRKGLARLSDRELVFGIRPEDIAISSLEETGALQALVTNVEPLGVETMVFADYEGASICVRTNPDVNVKSGDRVGLTPNIEKMHLFDATTGLAMR